MTFKEYIPLAVRTMTDLGSAKKNLAHMGLGLGSEMLELKLLQMGDVDDTIIGELGDLSWFTASTFHILNIEFKEREHSTTPHPERDLYSAVLSVVNLIKKHVAYGVPIINEKLFLDRVYLQWLIWRSKKFMFHNEVYWELHKLQRCLVAMAEHLDLDYSDILEFNIKKLAKRYPGLYYSDYYAAQRLDKNERANERANT